MFYKPSKKKKYKLGIIPHYVDKENVFFNKLKNNPDILIIDIEGGIKKVVDEICSCELIASSSLHGIIVADAYGIPSTWIKFSDNVMGSGFKFRDYFASVGRKDNAPLTIDKKSTIKKILEGYSDYELDIDLDKLLGACPFKKT
jgi:pyruvyltransferase